MQAERSSAVIAVCCRLPEGCPPLVFEDWARPVRDSGIAVTWIVGPADLEPTAERLAARAEHDRLALELPGDWFTADARQSLVRQRLAAVRRAAPSLDAVVVRSVDESSSLAGVRPEHLVEHGIRLVATRQVGHWHGRKSRRPGPPGWNCSSPTWGLWELGFSPRSPQGWLRSMLPLFLGPVLEPGGLSVIQAGMTATSGKREARQRFERILHWVARCVAAGRPRVRTATLSQLATVLAGDAAVASHRSVLAAA